VAAAQPNAAVLEAAGAEHTTFDFRGVEVTIPLAIEAWPLDEIRAGKTGRAIRALLGAQRPPLKTRDDAVELTHRMADACGVSPLPETPAIPGAVFGAVPTLLRLVDNYRDDLEADLRRFYGIDYRDPAAATLRQVWVWIRRLPTDSALLTARHGGEAPWTRAELIAARSWELWTRKRYDGRPWSQAELDAFAKAKREQDDENAKLAEREAYYASGQNMRDAGIDTSGMAFRPPGQSRGADDPAAAALARARKHAARSQQHRKAQANGRNALTAPVGRFGSNGRWDPGGSGW
jgi:hypothetical protein